MNIYHCLRIMKLCRCVGVCEVFGPGVYLLLSENNETLSVCEVVVFGPGCVVCWGECVLG